MFIIFKYNFLQHFMLIEFGSEGEVQDVLQSCGSHHKDFDVMAVQSPFLWFRAASGDKENLEKNEKTLTIKNGNDHMDEDILFEDLIKCETISDQIQLLYQRTTINDLGIRLRYMVARQVGTCLFFLLIMSFIYVIYLQLIFIQMQLINIEIIFSWR